MIELPKTGEFPAARRVIATPGVFDEHAVSIAERQYLQPGDGGIPGMFARVARWVAAAEAPTVRDEWATVFQSLMESKRFCPGGRVLAGAGTKHGNVLNCFVQGATANDPSSFEGVLEVARKLALVTKVGGGNGVNLDVFKPQSGEARRDLGVRGWAYMRADHPDVLDFIRGLMRPPTEPDGAKRETVVRNWSKVIYGFATVEALRLARLHGVTVVQSVPNGVLVVEDDMSSIIDAAGQVAASAKDRAEPRIDLSRMRPEGAPILGSGGTSSGPVSFLFEIFDNFLEWANLGAEEAGPVNVLRYCFAPVLRVVRQGGTRRGAGMATISAANPDVLDFLTAKDLDREAGEGDISTFNISILATSAFFEAVRGDTLWPLTARAVPGKFTLAPQTRQFEDSASLDLPALSDGSRPVPLFGGQVPARWLWRQIAEHAWSTGEPGLIFIDRVNEYSALRDLGPRYEIRSTNPCGEIPLTVGEPCDLGAINLAEYVTPSGFDFAAFRPDVRDCIRFLDDVLDVNHFALDDNREASGDLRRLGLGVMGLADALIKLGLRYDDQDGRDLIDLVMTALREEAVFASEQLSVERGVYPLYAREATRIAHAPRRNVAVLTVAPTGTTSMLMGVSSGIEPVFSPFVYRKIGAQYKALIAPLFQELLESFGPHADFELHGVWDWEKVTDAVSANHGSVQGLDWVPAAVRRVFVCAHDVPPLDHVRMQGVVQRAFDLEGLAGNSLSKTINLPNTATVQDVEAAYSEAYLTGCKGITVYRDGSRQFQVLNTSKSDEVKSNARVEISAGKEPAQPTVAYRPGQPVYPRPARLPGVTDMVKLTDTAAGAKRTFLITTSSLDGRPIEVILVSGRAGDEANADSEALGRVVSIALQYGVPADAIQKTLRGINGGLYGSYNGRLVASKADLVAVALESTTAHGEVRSPEQPLLLDPSDGAPLFPSSAASAAQTGEACPECKSPALVREEGCVKCQNCGYSKCG